MEVTIGEYLSLVLPQQPTTSRLTISFRFRTITLETCVPIIRKVENSIKCLKNGIYFFHAKQERSTEDNLLNSPRRRHPSRRFSQIPQCPSSWKIAVQAINSYVRLRSTENQPHLYLIFVDIKCKLHLYKTCLRIIQAYAVLVRGSTAMSKFH